MHFWRGIALDGSEEVLDYAASHGCVRLFIQDARWLNEEFIDLVGAFVLKFGLAVNYRGLLPRRKA